MIVKMTVRDFLDYLRCELNRSQRTTDSYAEDLYAFEAYFLAKNDGLSWETIDSDVIRDWMESMVDKGNAPATVARRLSALKCFYKYALSRDMVSSDPAHGLRSPKREKPLPQFLKENEVDEMLDGQAWGDDFISVRDRLVLMTFYETGMRLSELIGLDDESVDLQQRQVKVTGKGNKQRIIPFGNELKDTLAKYLMVRNRSVRRKAPAFFLTERGARMSPENVRRIVKENLSKFCSLKKKSPHVLRHTFATSMLNHGADIESLKQLLGHSKLTTTEIYTHTTFEQLKRVYNEAHPRA